MNEKAPEEVILEDEDVSASPGDALQETEGVSTVETCLSLVLLTPVNNCPLLQMTTMTTTMMRFLTSKALQPLKW